MRKTTLIVTAALVGAIAMPALAQPPAPPGGGARGGMQRTPERFAELDKNTDSKLSKEEFAAGLPEQARAAIDQVFPLRDTNSDTFLSLEEFTAPGRGGRGGPAGGAPPAP